MDLLINLFAGIGFALTIVLVMIACSNKTIEIVKAS